jgi:DNA-binding PadR family transcriptional regulator
VFSPQQFEILLSLTDQDRHGYGIIQDVSDRTGGEVRLGTGALYTAIRSLAASGLIRETDQKDEGDARRRYYRLTAAGRRALEAEVARLDALLATARQKGVRPRSIRGRS